MRNARMRIKVVVLLATLVALAGFWRLVRAQVQNQSPGKVYVILWFDTEDYILPQSDDAAKRLAVFLTQQRIKATFKVVGERGARSMPGPARCDRRPRSARNRLSREYA